MRLTGTKTIPLDIGNTVNRGDSIAWHGPATEADVADVLALDEDSDDGRSDWRWVRLVNGDLMLGVFPQGDGYFAFEKRTPV